MADRYAVWLDRDVIAATGPEAATYLQGQLSQDVPAIAAGSSAWSWLLSPQGKVDALLRVTRRSDEDWLLDTDAGWGEAVLARLNKFKLRSKVQFEAQPWRVLRLVGASDAAGEVVVPFAWGGGAGVDVFGPEPAVPDGYPEPVEGAGEVLRVSIGFPKMGAELTDKTIPAEVGFIDRTVSFTKGCYTGQELVARIDSRGSNVPRRLRALSLAAPVEVGTELVDADGKPVGTVTSRAESPAGWIGLGYVRRAVEVPAELRAGAVTVGVRELPV